MCNPGKFFIRVPILLNEYKIQLSLRGKTPKIEWQPWSQITTVKVLSSMINTTFDSNEIVWFDEKINSRFAQRGKIAEQLEDNNYKIVKQNKQTFIIPLERIFLPIKYLNFVVNLCNRSKIDSKLLLKTNDEYMNKMHLC
eukprot:440951_1